MQRRRSILLFLFLFFLAPVLIAGAYADIVSLGLQPRQEKVVSFDLSKGDSVSGTITINGVASVDFWITDPQNRNITVRSNVGNAKFAFDAQIQGVFFLHVSNPNSSPVSGTLEYTLVHRIFGMPQELFMLLVIVAIILLMIIVWASSQRA